MKSIAFLLFGLLLSPQSFAVSAMPEIEMPIIGDVTFIAGLGVARSGGRRHQGVDLGADMGDPVVAAWDGVVTKTGKGGKGGWAVYIEHANGFTTYYAHLKSKPMVHAGEEVHQGQQLGGVGMSGNARGTVPHLHFEVHQGRKLLNPLTYLGSM